MKRQHQHPVEATVAEGHPFFDLTEEAYNVFSYPKPSSTGVCENCCMDPEIEADLFNPPIRRLPLDYIRDWYSGAYDPEEGVPKEVWGYLLPRVLEILASGEDAASVGLELTLNRFDTGNPENWSGGEWRILDSFQKLFLREMIEQKSFTPDGNIRGSLDDTLCMFRLAGWPLDVLLDQVAAAPDVTLALRFWNDWCSGSARVGHSISISAFWNTQDNRIAFNFYTSRSLYDRMELLALDDDTESLLAAMASEVASVIEVYADWSLGD